MSTTISDAALAPATRADDPGAGDHQSRSWPILSALLLWAERRRLRDALRSRIDDERLLDDIGLSREQALREASKLFWQ